MNSYTRGHVEHRAESNLLAFGFQLSVVVLLSLIAAGVWLITAVRISLALSH